MNGGFDTPILKPRDFSRICELAYSRCGLNLKEGKERLVSSRLAKLIRKGGFQSFEEYYEHVVRDKTGEAVIAMIDSLTTNHTSFLREPEHFRFLLSQVVPEYVRRGVFPIWSAASSTGEEPYSILFSVLSAQTPGSIVNVEIRATDISTRVLTIAREALYPSERLSTVPPDWLPRFFQREMGPSPAYRVKPEYRRAVRFERLNLMEPFPISDQYPVIFCRNVMIYFDRNTRADLVRRLSACLEPGGYLFVGHAESLIGIDHPLTYIRPAVYRKAGDSQSRGRR